MEIMTLAVIFAVAIALGIIVLPSFAAARANAAKGFAAVAAVILRSPIVVSPMRYAVDSPDSKTNPNRKAEYPRQIADCVAGFLKDGDLEGVVSMFHPECRIFFPPNEPPKIGKEGAREIFAEFIEMRPTLISTITSEVIVGDTALLHAVWRFEDANGTIIAEGNSTEVAKMQPDGGWRYYIDCPLGAPQISP